MAYSDFIYPGVLTDLGLQLRETSLFGDVLPVTLSVDFARRLHMGARLASLVNTEKARPEFVVAPLLLELQMNGVSVGVFSGVELKVDAKAGLTGVCDFVLSQSPLQSVLTSPLVAVVEAKNDNLRNGYGQCIAEMFGIQLLNRQSGVKHTVYGVVTTGSLWQFLQLTEDTIELDATEHAITNADRILGILQHIVQTKT